jgi:hypothetical protein
MSMANQSKPPNPSTSATVGWATVSQLPEVVSPAFNLRFRVFSFNKSLLQFCPVGRTGLVFGKLIQ